MVRKILFGIAICVMPFCIVLLPLAPQLLLFFSACSTTTKISNLSEFEVHITETICSTLATDAAVRVFISKTGDSKTTLLFRYGPTDYLPTINLSDPHTLLISVTEISRVHFRRDEWEGLSIKYDIGSILYLE